MGGAPRGRGCSLDVGLPLGSVIVIAVVEWRWPQLIPFPLDRFLRLGLGGTWQQIAGDVWPIFAVGAGIALATLPLRLDRLREHAGGMWMLGPAWIPITLLRTASAGVWEEVVYRWLLFFAWIPGVVLLDYLLLGFAGLDLVRWLYVHVAGPLADLFTLHRLHFVLFGAWGWTVGAAVIVADGRFRSGHAYQGWVGAIWSWFGGMALFLVMFRYGLLAAILVHILYNCMVEILLAIAAQFVTPKLPVPDV